MPSEIGHWKNITVRCFIFICNYFLLLYWIVFIYLIFIFIWFQCFVPWLFVQLWLIICTFVYHIISINKLMQILFNLICPSTPLYHCSNLFFDCFHLDIKIRGIWISGWAQCANNAINLHFMHSTVCWFPEKYNACYAVTVANSGIDIGRVSSANSRRWSLSLRQKINLLLNLIGFINIVTKQFFENMHWQHQWLFFYEKYLFSQACKKWVSLYSLICMQELEAIQLGGFLMFHGGQWKRL